MFFSNSLKNVILSSYNFLKKMWTCLLINKGKIWHYFLKVFGNCFFNTSQKMWHCFLKVSEKMWHYLLKSSEKMWHCFLNTYEKMLHCVVEHYGKLFSQSFWSNDLVFFNILKNVTFFHLFWKKSKTIFKIFLEELYHCHLCVNYSKKITFFLMLAMISKMYFHIKHLIKYWIW